MRTGVDEVAAVRGAGGATHVVHGVERWVGNGTSAAQGRVRKTSCDTMSRDAEQKVTALVDVEG